MGIVDIGTDHKSNIWILERVKGGPGSGNFDHAGRPGKVGGSVPSLTTPGASARFGIGGDSDTFEIVASGGARASGYFRNSDFPGERMKQDRAELFYVDAGDRKRRGIGTSLSIDALRIMKSMGANTVVMFPTTEAGRGLVGRLLREGYISGPVKESKRKSEYKIEVEETLKGGPGSGHHGHSGRPGKRGGSAPGGRETLSLDTVLDNLRSVGYEVRDRAWGQWVSPNGKGISPTNERGIVNHWELAVDAGWLPKSELDNLSLSPNDIVNGLISKGWLRYVGNGFATWDLPSLHRDVIERYATNRLPNEFIYLDIVGKGKSYRFSVQEFIDSGFDLRKTLRFAEVREYKPSAPIDLDAVRESSMDMEK